MIPVINGSYQKNVFHASLAESDILRSRTEDLVKICESTAWSFDPEIVYQRMADSLAVVLDCNDAYIHLLTVTGDHLTKYAAYSDSGGLSDKEGRSLSITTGRMPWMMMTHQPIIMDFLHPHREDRIPSNITKLGYRSAASVPLLSGDDVLGMYTIICKKHQRWTEQDVDYLLAIGRLLGVSIQHMQMSKKTIELQTLNERKRLSTEIHDNLSQLISLLKLGAETAMISYEEGDDNAVHRDLARLESISQQALQVLREEILFLRTPVDQTKGLVSGIKGCLARFDDQWQIATDLQVKDVPEPVVVSMQMELQLTRILHECLSNTLRHAAATQVSVLLEGDEKRLCMQIHDNGCGFDPQAVPSGRLGIRIMRERADSLGGQLTVQSSEKSGTTVRVDIPRSAWQ